MTAINVEFSRVVEATRIYVQDELPRVSSWDAPAGIARALGILDQFNVPRTRVENQAREKFLGQVTRALNKLAEAGELIKVGRDQQDPWGRTASNEVWYYTPQGWDAATAEAAQQREAQLQAARRWETIHDRLSALGAHPATECSAAARQREPELTARNYERLLDLAEGGREHPALAQHATHLLANIHDRPTE
jgi:hypothetical protein